MKWILINMAVVMSLVVVGLVMVDEGPRIDRHGHYEETPCAVAGSAAGAAAGGALGVVAKAGAQAAIGAACERHVANQRRR